MEKESETGSAPAAGGAVARMGRGSTPLIAGLIVVVLVAGLGYWYYASGRESTDDAQVEGHITPVGARVGGAVLEVLVRDNQIVHEGDVLVRIDPRDYEVALAGARAELADAEAALAAADVGLPIVQVTSSSDVMRAAGSTAAAEAAALAAEREIDAAKARLRAAEAGVTEAEATADRAQKDKDRLQGLAAKEEISAQQFDAAVAAADVAAAGVESARAALAEAHTGVAVAESHLAQSHAATKQAEAGERTARTAPQQVRSARARRDAAAARVEQAQAAVRQAELRLEYAVIKAPSDGVVSRKNVEPGQILQAGQSLLALVSLDDVWVVANFKETQLALIAPGQRAVIAVDAYDHDVEGTVESIAAATGAKFSLLPAENASGNFVKVVQRVPVRIAIAPGADPKHRLRPGMSVVPTIYTR